MAKKNDIIRFNGDVGSFTPQKAVKDNELKTLKSTVHIHSPKFGEVAKLCADPAAAEAAMEACDEANSEIDIPVKKCEFLLRWKDGKKVVAKNGGVVLRKFVFDAQDHEVKIQYGEPFIVANIIFYAENLGAGYIVEMEPEQKALDFEGENTDGEDGDGDGDE